MERAAGVHVVLERARALGLRLERALDSRLLAPARAADEDAAFLPNFCNGWVIFNVVAVAELLAIMLNLVVPRDFLTPTVLGDLLVISLFVQWVALGGTAALCYARRTLNRLPNLRALAMAFLLLLVVTFAVTELSVWLLWAMGKTASPHPEWYGGLHVLTLTISAIVNGLLLRYFLAKHELERSLAAEARARLQAQQARIRPHFVFGTLNIIAGLMRSAPDRAEAALEDMADLFRMMLSQDETLVPVKNEIDVAKKFLALEGLRLDNRLQVEWDIGKFPRRAVMPVLTLQPLLENAIRHGIEPRAAGGTVRIRLWEENERICVRVANPLAPVRAGAAHEPPGQSLEDIRTRLRRHYGEAATLTTAEAGGQFTVTVALPTRGGEA